jgi:hypothetical protein
MNDRGVEALVAQFGDGSLTSFYMQLRAQACGNPSAWNRRIAVTRAA